MIDVCPGFPDRLHPGRKWIVSWFSGRRPSRSPDVKNEVTPNLETYKWTFIVEKERVNNQTSWASGAILECVHNRLQMYVKYVSPHYAGEGEGFFLQRTLERPFSGGTSGRQITKYFDAAGICKDIRVTAILKNEEVPREGFVDEIHEKQ